MLLSNDIKFKFNCQGFISTLYDINEEKTKSVLMLSSKRKTNEVVCPICAGRVRIYDSFDINLKDIPALPNTESIIHCTAHRYRCTCNKLSIRSIQSLTGIHWDTPYVKYNVKLRNQLFLKEKQNSENPVTSQNILLWMNFCTAQRTQLCYLCNGLG